MSEEEKGFVLKEGNDQNDKTNDKDPKPPVDKNTEKADEHTENKQSAKDQEEAQLPKIDFSMFSFSLNQSALMHLGVIADPTTGGKTKNLPLAKQTIDILGMLEEKTKGNLSKDESEMLIGILYNLRMIYIKETK